MRELPSIERLRELVEYNPETGHMFYKTAAGYRNNRKAGRPVSSIDKDGYVTGTLDGVRFFMHRVAFALANGVAPSQFIDHINGEKSDNRAVNLRDVGYTTNNENQRSAPSSNKQSRLLGVHRAKGRTKWVAKIKVAGKGIHLGCFNTPEEAYSRYVAAKQELHQGNTL